MLRLNVDMKSSDDATPFTIGEIAQRFGLATHVLRHWESIGLLTPARFRGQRRYRHADLYRVATILRAKQAGLSLDQIHQMITVRDPEQRTTILGEHSDQLRQRIAATQQALDVIGRALRCEHEDFTRCPDFQEAMTGHLGLQPTAHPHDRTGKPRTLRGVPAHMTSSGA